MGREEEQAEDREKGKAQEEVEGQEDKEEWAAEEQAQEEIAFALFADIPFLISQVFRVRNSPVRNVALDL